VTNPVVQRLRRHGLRPRKSLGQHFLLDARVLQRIVESVAPAPGKTIVEFGAGVGVLTESLLEAGAHVVAVEIDDGLAELLRQELQEQPRFELLHMDLADLDVAALRERLDVPRLKLVGNLPYQLTSTVLFGVLDLEEHLEDALFMVQREVAERIVSPPESRSYGVLSVLLQTYYDVTLPLRVRPGAFLPPPRVESALLRLVPRSPAPALPWSERNAFVHLVRSVFNERRKILRNTLRKFYGLDAPGLARCEEVARVDLGRRPESLGVDEFVRLLHGLPGSTRSGAEV